MTNNKQTAVEWLAEQMEILHYDYWAEYISKDEKNQRLKQLKEQAKEMEKQQRSIQLPSDEEIKESMGHYDESDTDDEAFLAGAKWMRDKIQGGIK
jgi:hypothetical protein